jgi:hypothetical protein
MPFVNFKWTETTTFFVSSIDGVIENTFLVADVKTGCGYALGSPAKLC